MPQSPSTVFCEVCTSVLSKYKCPQCAIRTCSLPCIQSHKLESKCSGQRIKTQYVPMEHYTENTLFSDYSFLEEISRTSDVAARLRSATHHQHSPLSPKQKALLRAATLAKVNLSFLPKGMSRAKQNRSSHDFKSSTIYWSVELDISHLCILVSQPRVVLPRVPEHLSVHELVMRFSDPASLESLAHPELGVCLAPVLHTPFVCYWRLPRAVQHHHRVYVSITDPKLPIRSLLQSLDVLEFPTLVITHTPLPHEHVVAPPATRLDPAKTRPDFEPLPATSLVDSTPAAPSVSPWAMNSAMIGPSLNTCSVTAVPLPRNENVLNPYPKTLDASLPATSAVRKSPWVINSTVGTPSWP